MARQMTCQCGHVVTAADDDELVRKAEEHMAERHPELVGKMSRSDILGMAEDV